MCQQESGLKPYEADKNYGKSINAMRNSRAGRKRKRPRIKNENEKKKIIAVGQKIDPNYNFGNG
jgi:hypothetical protein